MKEGVPIRASLGILVLATALPFVALLAYNLYSVARLDTEHASAEAVRAAHATAAEAADVLRRARLLLSVLSNRPAVRSLDPNRCAPIFGAFVEFYPEYTNLVTVRRDGSRVCSATRLPPNASPVVDPGIFLDETLRSGTFTIGQVIRGVFSKRWILAVAHPLTDDQGEIQGAVSLPIDLAKLQLVPRAVELPPQAVARIVDASGMVIGSSVAPDRWIGESFSNVAWFRLLERGRVASARAVDLDGGERIFGSVPIEGTPWHAVVGIPVDEVYGPARSRLILSAVIGLVALLMAAMLGYLIARRIAVPVEAIAAAAREASRSPSSGGQDHPAIAFAPREIRALAGDFRAMLKARLDAEAELHESEAGLRRAQAMAQLAHVVSTPDGVFASWSETLPQLVGRKPEDMPKSTREWLGLVHPDDRAAFRAAAIEAARSRQRLFIEYRIPRPGGEWINVRQMSEPLPAADGRAHWFGTLQNITAQKRAAEAIRRSEGLKVAIAESALDCLVTVDHRGNVIEFNPAAEATFGFTAAETRGRPIAELIIPHRFRDAHRSGLAHYLATGEGPMLRKRLELSAMRADGTEFPVELTVTPITTGAKPIFTAFIRDITERKRVEAELQRFRLALDNSADLVLIIDRATMRHVDVNQTVCRLLGYSREELLHMGPQDLLPVSRAELEETYDALIAAAASLPSGMESYYRCKDGSHLPFQSSRHVFRAGERWMVAVISRDMRERIAAEQALRESEAGLKRLNRVYAVLSGINSLIVRVRERQELFEESCRLAVEAGGFTFCWIGVVDRVARRLRAVASQGGAQEYIDRMPLDLDPGAPKHGLAAQAIVERRAIVVDDMASDERVLLKEEARERSFRSLVILPLIVAGEAVAVLALYASEIGFFDDMEMKLLQELAGDVSFALEHIEKADRLEYLAYHDSLTGLANRALLMERLVQATGRSAGGQAKFALIIADIARFKIINDTLGRAAGDELLKQMAGRLTALTGDANRVARLSGDHFAVLIPGVSDETRVARIIEAGNASIEGEPFRVGGTELRVAVRSGIAVFPQDGAEADTLFKNAEAALKNARAGGEKYLFYARQMTERIAGKLSLENKLRLALQNDELVLHYQPKVALDDRSIVGLEALIRWQSPELGLVAPMRFIPLLEETGLILPVGSWALKRASLDHRGWVEQGLNPPRVAVNVSAIQLRQRDFVAVVRSAISSGVAPVGIDLEITESLIMEDIQHNIEKLNSVRLLGVNIAIDDFGTGYSSLAYLARLPVETLKIDRSFIAAMLNDPNSMLLVQTIISLAHSLRLKVVAEGVEAEEQANVLRLLRCDQMQGYVFSKPLPLAAATALLRA